MELQQQRQATRVRGITEMMQNTIKIAEHVDIQNGHQVHVQEAHGQIIKMQVFMEKNAQHVVEFIQLVHTLLVRGDTGEIQTTTKVVQRVVI